MQMKGRGLPTLVQFVWIIKHLRHIKYAVAHAQCLRPKVEIDDRKFNTKYAQILMNVYFCLEAMIGKVLTRLRQKFFKERRRTMA